MAGRLLLLLCLLRLAAGSELTVDLDGPVPPGRVDALLAGFGRPGLRLDTRLAARTERLHLHLRGADLAALRQAAAHAAGAWWLAGEDGATLLTRQVRLPSAGPLQVATWLSPQPIDSSEAAALSALLDPWLGEDRGLAAQGHRLTVLLDGDGRARFDLLLRSIEGRQPLQLAWQAPGDADPQREAAIALDGPWTTWTAAAASRLGCSVALDPLAAAATPPRLLVRNRTELLAGLQAAGLAAAWRHGVICIGGEADERQHPARRSRVALLPIGHLPLEASGPALQQRLAAVVPPSRWRQPGWGLHELPLRQAFLVAADEATLLAVIAALEAIERTLPSRDPPPGGG